MKSGRPCCWGAQPAPRCRLPRCRPGCPRGARSSVGATVNDALLAAVASGYRAALKAAGEEVPARLPVSVPVALPRRGSSRNQAHDRPTAARRTGPGRAPPAHRHPDPPGQANGTPAGHARVHARTHRCAHHGPCRSPPAPHRRLRHQRSGPAGPLRLAGAPVVAIWPVSVLAANVRLGVAAVSYDGRLCCGVHFDADSVPGAEFSRAMGEELARLARGNSPRPAMA